MDLIDLRSIRDGEFQWILHIKDHFSKFSWAYPLCSKEAQSVAEKLLQQFYLFGVPKILQSDNGKEFVAKVIKVLIFISSRSRATFLILNRI
jgi:transposase InsO family protein